MLGRLVICPSHHADESWYGYFLRLADANGFRGINGLERAWFVRLEKLDYESAGLPPSVISLRVKNSSRACTRVCPSCLAGSNPYIRSHWDKPLVFVCEKHRCLLVDECNACGAAITYRRRRLTTCDCGMDYGTILAPGASGWMLELPVHLFGFRQLRALRREDELALQQSAFQRALAEIELLSDLQTGAIRTFRFQKEWIKTQRFAQLEPWFEHGVESLSAALLQACTRALDAKCRARALVSLRILDLLTFEGLKQLGFGHGPYWSSALRAVARDKPVRTVPGGRR